MSTHFGRPRTLTSSKKLILCEQIAQGASVEEAAEAVGVSLRTVQRARKADEDFDHDVRVAQQAPPDPLKLMHSAARTHWRAAAWLLEREDPERYGRRSPSSCSPIHFDQALEMVLEAALEAVEPCQRSQVYKHVKAACEKAFQAAFPAYGPWDKPKLRSFPDTPLVREERYLELCDPERIIGEPAAPHQQRLLPERTGNPMPPSSPASRAKQLPKAADPAALGSAPLAPWRHKAQEILRRLRNDQHAAPPPPTDQRHNGVAATPSPATPNPLCREKCVSRQKAPPAVERPAATPPTNGSSTPPNPTAKWSPTQPIDQPAANKPTSPLPAQPNGRRLN